jgi:hypothetical protein
MIGAHYLTRISDSMEEASALADEVGILARRMLGASHSVIARRK